MSYIPEKEVIDYAEKYFGERGYAREGKRWLGTVNGLTVVFTVQTSYAGDGSYYIRPGVFVGDFDTYLYSGHFTTDLPQDSVEHIFSEFESFIAEWTDRKKVKAAACEFREWLKRNPPEVTQTAEALRGSDPIPSPVFISVPSTVIDYVIKNF